MPLNQLIAGSGERFYENIRKGFYERPEEERARKLEELKIGAAEVELGEYTSPLAIEERKTGREAAIAKAEVTMAESERKVKYAELMGSLDPTASKEERQAARREGGFIEEADKIDADRLKIDKMIGEIEKNEVAMEKMQTEIDKNKSETQAKAQNTKDYKAIGLIEPMLKQYKGDPDGLKAAITERADELRELGDDSFDDNFDRIQNLPNEQYEAAMQSLPIAFAAIQELRAKQRAKGKGSSLTNIGKASFGDFTVASMALYEKSRNPKDLVRLEKKSTGSSEFERLEVIPESNRTKGQQRRYEVLAGLTARAATERFSSIDLDEGVGYMSNLTGEITLTEFKSQSSAASAATLAERKIQHESSQIKYLYDNYTEASKNALGITESVDRALAAMDSGDIGLSDTMLAQINATVSGSKSGVKAFQMYKVFDESYGDVLTRIGNAIETWITGSRSEEAKDAIRSVLENYRDQHAIPALNKIKTYYRSVAIQGGINPLEAIPPTSEKDIHSANATRKQKIEAMKTFYPNFGKKQ